MKKKMTHKEKLAYRKHWDAVYARAMKVAVPIPPHPKYRENSERCRGDETSCIVCGKPVKDANRKLWLRAGPGGKDMAIPGDWENQGPAEMGCWPIGPDCLRKNPALAKLAFKMKAPS